MEGRCRPPGGREYLGQPELGEDVLVLGGRLGCRGQSGLESCL